MGVSGLHKLIKPIVQEIHISRLRGQAVAIDASSWLHRGLSACATQVHENSVTDEFLSCTIRLIELLERHEVRPLFVLDGRAHPSKNCESRREQRQAYREQGEALLREGRVGEARSVLAKSLGVTPWMSKHLIEYLRGRGVPFCVAPYEADAQLAFLVREGICCAAISEDSDLLPFGCPVSLFKLNDAGMAQMVELEVCCVLSVLRVQCIQCAMNT